MGLLRNYVNNAIKDYISKEVESVDPSAYIVKDEEFRKLENRAWFEASSASELENFYKTTIPSNLPADMGFYYKVQGKTPRIHVPVSQVITSTIVNLVFSETPTLRVDTGNKKTTEEYNKNIQDTLTDNVSEELFKKIGSMVSYSGSCGIKLTIDKDFSDRVIAEPYPAEEINVTRKYGRVYSITFRDYLEDGYILYTIDEPGHRYFELRKQGNDKTYSLDTLPITQGLHDWYLVDNKGNPIKELMSVYVENTDGKSDYDGCTDLFQLLDEIKSAMTHIQRTLKPKVSIPSSLCEIDRESGKKIIPNSWDREEKVVEVSDPESVLKNLNEVTFNSPDLSSYQELYDKTLKDILNRVSLSESTLGNNDGGSDASSLALNIREKSSLRKRAALITKYDRAFKQLAKLFLLMNYSTLHDDNILCGDFEKFEYFCDFSEYSSPSFDQMVEVLSKALSAGLISQREAISELYDGDMSEEEQASMLAEINMKSKNDDITEEDIENNEIR